MPKPSNHDPERLRIFKAGTHTASDGRTLDFSAADLDATAAAYDPAKHEAPLVVGHPAHDAPAYGWVKSLAACPSGLLAVPAQVDPVFAEAVGAGRYKKISASFYHPDSLVNPAPGVWYLRHVGFLGAMPPAVKGLGSASFAGGAEDFVTVEFGEEIPNGFLSRLAGMLRAVRDYVIDKDGLETADKVIPSWELDWLQEDAAKAQVPSPDPAYAEKTEEQSMPDDKKPPVAQLTISPEFEARVKALEAENAAFAERLRRHDADAAIQGAISSGRLTSAQATGLAEFMAALSDADEIVTFNEGDMARKYTPAAYLRTFLARLPVQVEFAEKSAPDPSASVDGLTPEDVARRAVLFQERMTRGGVVITTTEAVAAVKAGKDKEDGNG